MTSSVPRTRRTTCRKLCRLTWTSRAEQKMHRFDPREVRRVEGQQDLPPCSRSPPQAYQFVKQRTVDPPDPTLFSRPQVAKREHVRAGMYKTSNRSNRKRRPATLAWVTWSNFPGKVDKRGPQWSAVSYAQMLAATINVVAMPDSRRCQRADPARCKLGPSSA
jgi:hypothetical protein